MKPQNLEESKLVNYGVSNALHTLLLTFKAFSDNRFEQYLNKYHKTVDSTGEVLKFESVRPTQKEGNMVFCVWFEGATECSYYNFESEVVKNWLRGFADKAVKRMEFNELN
ncbi:MAG: hypothetical protein ACYDD5_00330 [Sulfuricurvum sp.]